MRQRDPCWQKCTSSNAQRSIAGSCAQIWSFFYARPAVGGRLCQPTGAAADNACSVDEITVGTVAHPVELGIAPANSAPAPCPPRDWPPGRPAPESCESSHAPLPSARPIIGRDDRCDCLRLIQPIPGGRNVAPSSPRSGVNRQSIEPLVHKGCQRRPEKHNAGGGHSGHLDGG